MHAMTMLDNFLGNLWSRIRIHITSCMSSSISTSRSVSKKCLAAWSELCFRISKLKSPHIKIVLDTDNSEYKSYRISEKSFVLEPGVL